MATILAQAKMEEMMSDDAVSSGSDYIDSSGNSMDDAVGTPPGAVFARRWIAQASPGDPGSFVLQVSVAILHDGLEAARLASFKTSSLR
jgi:hypothetical protein